jgi:hypothetical protein
MNDVVSLGLEPFSDRLAPSHWNQASEDDGPAWLPLNSEPADSEGLHPAFKYGPFITDDPSRR